MSTLLASNPQPGLRSPRVLVVGLGGLGSPVLAALARQPGIAFLLADDDVVDESNLHRQILFDERHLGRDKATCAAERLREWGVNPELVQTTGRLLPHNARALIASVDWVVEGADNYATKFLVADAAFLEQRPVVHGAAVGFRATVFTVSAQASPCYRCLFEDLPADQSLNCSSVGVIGPLVGFAGALMAERCLAGLAGRPIASTVTSYDAWRDRLRCVPVPARPTCPLCGPKRSITSIDVNRYSPAPLCAPTAPASPSALA